MSDPLYRQSFDAVSLLREHPPVFRHPHKRLLFELAYPDGVVAPGVIEVTRWARQVPNPIVLPAKLDVRIHPNFYDYSPTGDAATHLEWHVNFADPRLFCAYGSSLFAQDEMQVAEHPMLACVLEALTALKLSTMTCDSTGATPILVGNVERRIEVSTDANAAAGRPGGLYGNRFARGSTDAIRRATRKIEPPTVSNIIAMAAPSGGSGDYTSHDVESIFTTAATAFAAAVAESTCDANEGRRVVIHTGFWGCGAFGGNRRLMIALQALAARSAGVSRLVLHAGDEPAMEDARRGIEVADALSHRLGETCSLEELVGRGVMLGYRWGVSDGN